MTSLGLVRGAAATLAAFGMLLPVGPVSAQESAPAKVVAKADSKLAADIVMVDGAFSGRVVDRTGTPLVGQKVVVSDGKKEIATVSTNKDGVFSVASAKPGLYQATSGNTSGNFRVWSAATAPTAAKGHALLVMGENGARGQFGAVDPTLVLLTAAVITTAVLSGITLNKTNDIEDRVNQIPTSP